MTIIILLLAFLTLAALITGLVIMGRGGKVNRNLSNKLMIARVAFQAVALVAIIVGLFLFK